MEGSPGVKPTEFAGHHEHLAHPVPISTTPHQAAASRHIDDKHSATTTTVTAKVCHLHALAPQPHTDTHRGIHTALLLCETQ
jgi:hypothetical protein